MSLKSGRICDIEKKKKAFYKKWWFWLIVVVVIGVAGSGEGEALESSDVKTRKGNLKLLKVIMHQPKKCQTKSKNKRKEQKEEKEEKERCATEYKSV